MTNSTEPGCSACARPANLPPDLVCRGWPGAPRLDADGALVRDETAVPVAKCARLAAEQAVTPQGMQDMFENWRASRLYPEKRVRRRT